MCLDPGICHVRHQHAPFILDNAATSCSIPSIGVPPNCYYVDLSGLVNAPKIDNKIEDGTPYQIVAHVPGSLGATRIMRACTNSETKVTEYCDHAVHFPTKQS